MIKHRLIKRIALLLSIASWRRLGGLQARIASYHPFSKADEAPGYHLSYNWGRKNAFRPYYDTSRIYKILPSAKLSEGWLDITLFYKGH